MPDASDGTVHPAARERYTLGYDNAHLHLFQARALAMCAPYLVPHLHAGMTVLDCGCGPGSMTIELAHQVAPGHVVGVDIQVEQFERARALASERGVDNVRFEQGDAYALPFPAASFDAVFSHALISHLRDPMRALAEMRRVLIPGGIAAVAENDTGAFVFSPVNSALERFFALAWQVQVHNGGLRLQPRYLRGALLEVGFDRAEGHASAEAYGTPDGTRWLAAAMAANAGSDAFRQTVLSQGWASQAELDELPAALHAWAERPDAFGAALKCGALGWTAAR